MLLLNATSDAHPCTTDRMQSAILRQALDFRTRSVAKGEAIYRCGEQDSNLYLIESGQVKVSLPTENGKVCLLAIYTPGDVIGEQCLTGAERADMATAMKATVVRQLPYSKFIEGLSREGALEDFTRYLATRILEQQFIITHFVTSSSEHRLATMLLRLARKFRKKDCQALKITDRISCQELAEMVGTTRSRVGYFLKKFRELGLIETASDSFLIISEQRLTQHINDLMRQERMQS